MTEIPRLTGIGSFPPRELPIEDAIRAAVAEQRAHGFGLLTDGEPRGDMLAYYTSLPGIEDRGGVPRVVGRIRPLTDPAAFSKVQDLEFLRRAFPGWAFKVALTAPTTFILAAAASGAGPEYKGPMDPKLSDDLTEALRPIAHEIAVRGAHLQLDDPILSQGMRDYRPALERIEAIASEVPRARTSLHVCGGLARSKVLDALLRLERISTLSIAFAGSKERENLGLIGGAAWQERDIALGVGAASVQISQAAEVMTPGAVESLLRAVVARAGGDRIRYVSPDCGLRATPSNLVPSLLENLQKGFESVYSGPDSRN